jgi:glycosyltransferase involved in cell wall biosynthesis
MNERILVFIPCYNCASQIGRVLARFAGDVTRRISEVLVLDNGSTDGTVNAAIAAADLPDVPLVRVARNAANYNLGGSHKSAYAYAAKSGFSHVITLHGDDQGDISDVLPVLESGAHERFDANLGARFMGGARLEGYSPFRIVGNRVFNTIFSAAARRPIFDLGSGLNLLSHAAFADPAILRLPDDLHFNPYLLMDMIDRGNRIGFFPISWREEDQVSNVKMAGQAFETLGAALDYRFRRHHFRNADYRRVRHDSYVFDEIARFENNRRI